MGAWGTKLWEDDLSCDIQDEWNDFLDDGLSPKKATRLIEESWLQELTDGVDDEDGKADVALLYISLAALQMRHQTLTRKIKQKALFWLEKGADLHLWEEGDEADYLERKKVLEEFKEKLMNAKARFI